MSFGESPTQLKGEQGTTIYPRSRKQWEEKILFFLLLSFTGFPSSFLFPFGAGSVERGRRKDKSCHGIESPFWPFEGEEKGNEELSRVKHYFSLFSQTRSVSRWTVATRCSTTAPCSSPRSPGRTRESTHARQRTGRAQSRSRGVC